MTLYVNLADLLGTRIEQGFYRPGDRLPSVRALSAEHGVSLSTVQQAYRLLEDNGLASPRPKSGYFVPMERELPALPGMGKPAQRPVEISQWEQVLELVRSVPQKDVIQLGRGMPDVTTPTIKPLLRSLAQISRRLDLPGLYYDNVYGVLALREQLARLLLDSGCQLGAEDLVITTGCHEALSCSIRAVCEPGDIVAVDSPSFHGAMQTLKGLGMKALEIPTDPVTGISLEALELALIVTGAQTGHQQHPGFLGIEIECEDRAGALKGFVNEHHLHSLGKMLFAWTGFWAYIYFCQFMLIWYANIPEETVYFLRRADNGWLPYLLLLPVFKFVVPFLLMLPRAGKRSPGRLVPVAMLILFAQFWELYLMVGPAVGHGGEAAHAHLPLVEFAGTLGFLGLFTLVFGWALARHGAVPLKDPSLAECLEYHS